MKQALTTEPTFAEDRGDTAEANRLFSKLDIPAHTLMAIIKHAGRRRLEAASLLRYLDSSNSLMNTGNSAPPGPPATTHATPSYS